MNPRTAKLVWIAALLGYALFALVFLQGCSSPGGAGFRELARSNARERTALKAAAVRVERIGAHVARADGFAGKLARTKLTADQSRWLKDLRVELGQVRQERDALTAQLVGLRQEVETRDVTLRLTREASAAAAREGFWSRCKAFGWGFGLSGVLTTLLAIIFRASIKAALLYLRLV